MISMHSYSHFYDPKIMLLFVNVQVNPNYTSTFVFDNDFPAMLDASPAPGKCVECLLYVDFRSGKWNT